MGDHAKVPIKAAGGASAALWRLAQLALRDIK
jgi:hypothetical protein